MSTEQGTQQTSVQNPSKKVKIYADLVKSSFFFVTKNARKQNWKYKLSRHQKQNKPITWTGSFIALRYWPSGETSATEFNKFSRGMRTLSNLENKNATWVWCFNYAIKKKMTGIKEENIIFNYQIRPLSTPFRPILWPQSAMRIFGQMFPSSSLICTINAWTPSSFPLILSWEKTTVCVACQYKITKKKESVYSDNEYT